MIKHFTFILACMLAGSSSLFAGLPAEPCSSSPPSASVRSESRLVNEVGSDPDTRSLNFRTFDTFEEAQKEFQEKLSPETFFTFMGYFEDAVRDMVNPSYCAMASFPSVVEAFYRSEVNEYGLDSPISPLQREGVTQAQRLNYLHRLSTHLSEGNALLLAHYRFDIATLDPNFFSRYIQLGTQFNPVLKRLAKVFEGGESLFWAKALRADLTPEKLNAFLTSIADREEEFKAMGLAKWLSVYELDDIISNFS